MHRYDDFVDEPAFAVGDPVFCCTTLGAMLAYISDVNRIMLKDMRLIWKYRVEFVNGGTGYVSASRLRRAEDFDEEGRFDKTKEDEMCTKILVS